MSLKRREEKRLGRSGSRLERGLQRGRFDVVLEALGHLPSSARAPHLESARRLLVAAVRREEALGRSAVLADWGLRLPGSGLPSLEPEVAEAAWRCLWAAWELRPRGMPALERSERCRVLFEELWPAFIDRFPEAVDAADLWLRKGGAVDGDTAARMRSALAEVGRPSQRSQPERHWLECVRGSTSAREAEELVIGAWSVLGFERFSAGASDLVNELERAPRAPTSPLSGAGAGLARAACLETLERLATLQDPGENGAEGREWDALGLLQRLQALGECCLGAVREDLLVMWRAAFKRSGLLAGPAAEARPEALRALARISAALLEASPPDREWIAAWLGELEAPPAFLQLLLPLYQRALERGPSVALWAAAARAWRSVHSTDPPRPAESWLELGARRAFARTEELRSWLGAESSERQREFFQFVASHLEEGEKVLDLMWRAEPALRKLAAGAYHDLVERHRERIDVDALRRVMESLAGGDWLEETVDLFSGLDTMAEGPLLPQGKEVFRKVYRRALPYDPRFLLLGTELLDEGDFVEAGRIVISQGTIESSLYAVKVAETQSEFPGAASTFFEEALRRFGSEPRLLARGITYATGEGFPKPYLRDLSIALGAALEGRPEERDDPDVRRALEMSGKTPSKSARRRTRPGARGPRKRRLS